MVQVIKVSFINALGKTNGCEKAPNMIIESLKEIGCNESHKIINVSDLNLEEIHVDINNIEEAEYNIFNEAKEIIGKNFKSIFLGGDHSISYPLVRAFSKVEKNSLLIVFDAHADCVAPSKEPTHEEWLRKLIESGFPSDRVLLISCRNMWEEEINFLKEKKVTLIKMDVLREDIEGVCDIVMERARNSDGFYISIDIDAIDPAYAPGTGYIEPGGLSSRDFIYFLKRLMLLENFRVADIVEINPLKDINGMTVKLGAKILSELI